VTLPSALVGGVLAVYMTTGVLSLGSLVGFLTILGIAARNGIMMINHFQHLEKYEGEPFGPGLVLRGARERLSPILMTTLATGLALVPLVAWGSIPGHEIEHPLAVVVLGGLVTSTLLNLFVVPSLYLAASTSGTGSRGSERAGVRRGDGQSRFRSRRAETTRGASPAREGEPGRKRHRLATPAPRDTDAARQLGVQVHHYQGREP
jgi:hypothetical protein